MLSPLTIASMTPPHTECGSSVSSGASSPTLLHSTLALTGSARTKVVYSSKDHLAKSQHVAVDDATATHQQQAPASPVSAPDVSRKRPREEEEQLPYHHSDSLLMMKAEAMAQQSISRKMARSDHSTGPASGTPSDASDSETEQPTRGASALYTGAPRERRLKSLSQLVVLKNFYALHPRVSKDQVRKLISQTGLTHREVTRWFRNERHKEKKLKSVAASMGGSSLAHNTFNHVAITPQQQAALIENERRRNESMGLSMPVNMGSDAFESKQFAKQQQQQSQQMMPMFNPMQMQQMGMQPNNFYRGMGMNPNAAAAYFQQQQQFNPAMMGMGMPGNFMMPNGNGMMPMRFPSPQQQQAQAQAQVQQAQAHVAQVQAQAQAQVQAAQVQAQAAAAQAQQQFQSAMQATTSLLMQGANPAALMPGYYPGNFNQQQQQQQFGSGAFSPTMGANPATFPKSAAPMPMLPPQTNFMQQQSVEAAQ